MISTLESQPRAAGYKLQSSRCLWSVSIDALLLGGASVLAFVLIRITNPSGEATVAVGALMMLLANFVNHPHFAHSYQIFYSNWWRVRGSGVDRSVARRWWWAGVIAPALLAVGLGGAAWAVTRGNTLWIAIAINLMGALVGWHYVKQGFGMAMTDAALKRRFWSNSVRQSLLWNAYACWIAAWLFVNSGKGGQAFWGFFAIDFDVPAGLLVITGAVCFATTLYATISVVRALRMMREVHAWSALPLTGLLAYFVTIYLWTLFAWADSTYMLVIPFFHSLQYLTVVWRYKINQWRDEAGGAAGTGVVRQGVSFLLTGTVLGAIGFWFLPAAVDYARTGQLASSIMEPALGLVCAWLFINIHHYLIDNVLWRKGNPDVARYLFRSGEAGMAAPAGSGRSPDARREAVQVS